ncbi:MAG TPA: alpha/beta hydrolase [Thermoguttaceae bacterium]|nr:alpha/beta hydrolase [Thermoguttaceae bacterium]
MKLASTPSILLFLVIGTSALAEDRPLVLDVWPGEVPGEKGDIAEEKLIPRGPEPGSCERLTNVSKPTISVYRPKEADGPTAAVLICPGGGYSILAWDKEGTEVADWLNSVGVTGIVLKYRVPRRNDRPKHLAPLQDAQRAMSLVRSRAAQWNIDPGRIGILGFSAGGHLSATASTNFDQRAYEAIDETDKTSCRPDFAVLIYPAYLIEGDALAPEIRVGGQSPPTFFVHAGDDRISSENSVQMYLALKKAGVKTELHAFTAGGHGFGLRPSEHPCSGWPRLCEQWMRSLGLVADPTTGG